MRLIIIVLTVMLLGLIPSIQPVKAFGHERQPVVFTTEAEIARATQRVRDHQEPFNGAWLKIKAEADAALGKTYVAEQSYHHETYFGKARPQAQDARSLALAARITGDARYAEKAREILALWAEDALVSEKYAGWGSPHQMGLVIGRIMPIFGDAYAIMWKQMPNSERRLINRWFKKMITPITISRNIFKNETTTCDYGACKYRGEPGTYLGGNYFSNHLSAHNVGLLAIGYVLDDRALVRESLHSPDNDRDLRDLINGAIIMPDDLGAGAPDGDLPPWDPTYTDGAPMPEAGELWDRHRTTGGNGLHYSYLHLQMLVLQADMAKNNGLTRDWFDYGGPKGERLELPFTIYDDFLMSADPGARTGYYVNSNIEYSLLPLYEIAHREFPDNDDARTVLESFDRVAFEHQTFGWSLLLTDGADDLAISPDPYPATGKTTWNFDDDGVFEAVTVRKAQAVVADGALQLTISQDDPGVVTGDLLGLQTDDYSHVEVTMRNETADTEMVIYFITDDDTTYGGTKRVAIPVTAGDADYQTYRIDMRHSPDWTGRIRQLRIDPVQGTSPGTVTIDSIRVVQGG